MKKNYLKKWLVLFFLAFQILSIKAQCNLPFTLPTSNSNWDSFNRVSYTGGWMLNTTLSAYRDATTIRTELLPTQVHNAFGINDYATDTNFTGISTPIPTSTIIRVGQKIDLNSSVQMPAGSANFISFTFTPTTTNSKIRIYYIGAGEGSFNATSVLTNKFNSGQGGYSQPRFGVVCQYNYTSCTGSNSITGMNEFGLQTPNALPNPTSFSNPTNRLNYGKNDLFAGKQAGSLSTTDPLNTLTSDFSLVSGSSLRKMTSWKSYVLDFSEFVGLGSVTISLFSHCSSATNSLFDAYSYYQFACEGSGNVIPITSLNIQNTDGSSNFNLGCKNISSNNELTLNGLATNFPINTTPLLATNINNQTVLPWLNLPNSIYNTSPTSAIPSQLFSNNFATISLERLTPSGSWVIHNDLYHATVSGAVTTVLDDITIRLGIGAINATGFTAATETVAESYYYTFRIRYKTMNMCSEIVSNNFDVKINYITVPTCLTNETAPSIFTSPSLLINTESGLQNVYCNENFDVVLGPADCVNLTPESGYYFLKYQWQRMMPGVSWENLTGQTSQNLLNAQNFISPDHCNTSFRRLCITASTCTDGQIATTSSSTSFITIWNEKFIPIKSPVSATVTSYLNGNTSSLTNASNIEVCYGDTISINSTFNLGNYVGGCAGPNLGTNNQLFLQVVNPVTGQVYVDNNYTYNGYSTTGNYSFNFVADTTNGFSPTASNVSMTLLLKVRTIFDGCERVDFRVINLVIVTVKPRAIGGTIEWNPETCPLDALNDSSVYNNSNGGLYNWYYSTDNITWTLIPASIQTTGQNIDLAVLAIIGIPRPYYLKRESRSFPNCPTTAFSNTLFNPYTERIVPTFNLPSTICRTQILSFPTTSTNGVNGTWHLVNSITPVVYQLTSMPTTYQANGAGNFTYIFIPEEASATNGYLCADYQLYTVQVKNWITPTFSFYPLRCVGDGFTLPTVSDNGIVGTWSGAFTTNVYSNPTAYTFTPSDPLQCAYTKTITITVYPKIAEFNLPTSLCQFSPTVSLPANTYLGQFWRLYSVDGVQQTPAPITTFINTSTPGTFVYQYTANYVCDSPAYHTVIVNPKITPIVSLPKTICYGDTAPILPIAPSGITGTWSPDVVSNTTSATYTFTPDAGQCAFGTTYSLTVFPIPNPGTLSSSNTSIAVGTTTAITPTVTGGTWATANPTVATISPTGVVTGVGLGSAVITYIVTNSNGCIATVSFTITVQASTTCTATTLWDGSSWSNGVPNTPAFLNTAVVFTANFNTTEDLYACSLHVTNSAVVAVKHIGPEYLSNQGHTVTVANEVVVDEDAVLKFEDDTSLVQINNATNSGAIEYKRSTPRINKFDYTYWSTPVTGQLLVDLSPDTLFDKFFFWNPLINNWNNIPNTATMGVGRGYIIRGPQGYFDDIMFFDGYFNGIPNNGTITTPVYSAASKLNLIGNPYPSALDIDCFLSDPINAHLNGSVYLWSHNIPIDWTGETNQNFPGDALYNYNVNSYATYNRLGGVGTGITSIVSIAQNGSAAYVFNSNRSLGKIAAGQSFFIESNSTGTATFKNSMRVGSQNQQNSQFYRSNPSPAENSSCITDERHRLWLQIRNMTPAQQFKQTLVGYSPLATTSTALDRDYDAKTLVAEPYTINLYSLSPANEKLTIQGRQLGASFDVTDVIPLGFTCKWNPLSVTNTIEIAASEFDGLFNDTSFYLRETLSSGGYVFHDIKTTPFTFTITSDVIDNTTRFAIVFSTTAPKTNPINHHVSFMATLSPNPFDKGFTLQLQSPTRENVTVTVYDLLGKKLTTETLQWDEIENHILGTGLSTGMYQAVITQGEYKESIKIIKN